MPAEAASAQPRVAIGFVLRAHALAGELRVRPYNPDSELLAELSDVFVARESGEVRAYRVVSARRAGEEWLVRLEGVESRDAAEALRRAQVEVPRERLPSLPEGEVYLADLVGLEVVDDGRVVGRVTAYFEYPSVDCVEVTGESERFELPLLDAYVVRYALDEGRLEAARTDELPKVPLR